VTGRAFTLLELVAVLAVLGLIMGLTAPAAIRSLDRDAAREQVRDFARLLAAERLEAMQRTEVRTVQIEFNARRRSLEVDSLLDASRAWKEWQTAMVDAEGERLESARITFSADGRAIGPVLRFADANADGGDRAWRIECDPITGVPRVRSGLQAEADGDG